MCYTKDLEGEWKGEDSKDIGRSLFLKIGSAQGSSPTDPGLVDKSTFYLTHEKY
jgi:hypothetical protein